MNNGGINTSGQDRKESVSANVVLQSRYWRGTQSARCAVRSRHKWRITTRNGVRVINTNRSGLSGYAQRVTSNCIVLDDWMESPVDQKVHAGFGPVDEG
jgi:hypothetical protein